MVKTVNLSEAARLLRISLPTARRRVSATYKGPDRIRRAIRRGRDWRIPRSEIRRLVDQRAKQSARVMNAEAAYKVAFDVVDHLERAAYDRLISAAKALAKAAYDETDSDAIHELRRALRNHDGLNSSASLIIDGIAGRVQHPARSDDEEVAEP